MKGFNLALRLSVIIFVISGCLLFPCCKGIGSQKAANDYSTLKYPALGDIKMPQIRKTTLPNGMKLFLVEDNELPAISISGLVRTGSAYESADKIGLAAITGEVMRTGGTKTKTGDQIDQELESIAASVDTGIGLDSGSASMWVMKEKFDTALAILSDVLMNPVFAEDKIELSKIRHRSSIARRNDNASSIASREFFKLIYGADSVYARQTEYATINNITRDDLINFHQRFYHPNNVMLAVWGDFDTDQMIKKLEKAFEGWQKTEVQISPLPAVNYVFKPTVNLVQKDDINQSVIYMGHIGGLMNDPDYYALILMNRVLGTGFTSRLFKTVRSRMGLAYSVSGQYSANYSYPGVFYTFCQTKSAATVKAIRAIQNEIKKMTDSEVADEELAIAKESFLNSFVFNFDTKGKIVQRVMLYDYYGYPEDFLIKTRENVEKVTKQDILRVAKKHLRTDALQVLDVGKPADFDEPLSVLGQLNQIDITIPP